MGGEDHVSIGTDGGVSPVVVTPEFAARFRDNTRKRRELGIAASYEIDEGYLFASDLDTPRRLETLGEMLLARRHSEARVEKLLWADLLRVFGDAWQPT